MRLLKTCLAALALLFAATSHADPNAELRKNLAHVLPDFPADAKVIKTPYSGLYEVDVGNHVFYTDARGSFLINGEIYDTHTQSNVTQARLEQLSRIDWKQLPLQQSFKVVFGAGQRQVAVFEDPYCPYCQKLEQALAQVGNLTVHVFLLPVIRQESPAMARDIWCAPDAGHAWTAWMNEKKAPPKAAADCSTPIASIMTLARRYDIESTPTMVLPNGTRITGALDAAELGRRLAQP